MLKSAKGVSVAKGKKYRRFDPGQDEKAEIIKQVMGPSGNLRAPTYRVGDDYIVGFNADLYAEWVK